MKKTISSRNLNKKKDRSRQNLTVNSKATKALKTVPDREAFYFYEAVGKPTGQIARNLSDFLENVKCVKAECLLFHLQRKDFQNWIGKVLGDSELAKEVGGIPLSDGDTVRVGICKTVENRLKELNDTSRTVLSDDNVAVILPSSQCTC
jgi:hypothetical protein